MPDDREIERLILRITDQVVDRLGAGPSAKDSPRPRRVVVLLPDSTGRMQKLALQLDQIRSAGATVQVLAAPEVLGDIDSQGLRHRLGPEVSSWPDADLSSILAKLDRQDLIVVGTIGFESGRSLVALRDEKPWIRLVSLAVLAGARVAVVMDDLSPSMEAARAGTRAAAERLLRELEAMGLQLIRTEDLLALVERMTLASSTLSQSMAGLLTEQDVNRLVAEGEHRLVLSAGTLVTPLASSRAAELGVEILWEED